MKPKLLDLFCGAGGASMGYCRAGFEVVGVDIKPQPHYPFPFIHADAIELMGNLLDDGEIVDNQGCYWTINGFDAYHASPPCYENTWSARRWIDAPVIYEKTDQLVKCRMLLPKTNKLFVLENTPGAVMSDYIRLEGTMFGLQVIRERWFELHGFDILMLPCPLKIKAPIASGEYFTVAGHGGDSKDCKLATWQKAMGIVWMNKEELTQAIPPAYTEYIGKYLLDALKRR